MKRRRYIILVFLLGHIVQVYGQSLDDLIKLVQNENLQLRSIDQEYFSMLEKAPQVGQLPDPEVNAGIFVRAPETRVGPQIFKLGVSQMFPWKGTLDARQEVVLAKAQVKREELGVVQRDLVYQVKTAYYNLYELEKSQEIVRRNLMVYEALDRFALSRVESGKGSSADVLRVQLKRQELEQELQILENSKTKSLAMLNQVLNRPVDTRVTISDSLQLATLDIQQDTMGGHLSRTHPAISLISRMQEVAHKELNLNNLNGKPSFGVGLDYVMVNKRNDVDIRQNGKDIIMPMAKVSIPLNRTRYGAKEREEQLRIAALEDRKLDMRNMFLAIIEGAISDINDATLRVELYHDLIRTTEATVNILETTYSTSGRGFDELLRLQSELITYDLKILKAIVRSQIAKATVERYITS